MADTIHPKLFARHLQKAAEHCRQTLVQTPFTQVTPAQIITISCGLAFFNGQSWEQLLHDADLALYRAKHKGRNTVSF
ncbi:GGDEF domain-containing protein [Shewanella colwelliana]|uniref:GGDEF domain-containing protein n=1 Tax=Shewanella colwelliana TaxID=23 RepID=UPI0022B01B22|nr:diguanylate cyclase [Shewanella colwelliana]MCZ4338162.1 diguanylate cyclase [Shewanella colwelliana]